MVTHSLLFTIQSSLFHIHFSVRSLSHRILDSYTSLFVCVCVWFHFLVTDATILPNIVLVGCAKTNSLPLIIHSIDSHSFIRTRVQTELVHLVFFDISIKKNSFIFVFEIILNPFESLYHSINGFELTISSFYYILVSSSVSVLIFDSIDFNVK